VSFADILNQREAEILRDWVALQLSATTRRIDLINDVDLQRQSLEFLRAFQLALESGTEDINTTPWKDVRQLLEDISASRARQGFTPSETATFVFSLKQPLFRAVQSSSANGDVGTELWKITILLDRLGLMTTEVYQKSREEIINR
jgi:rsbT co-antagonist protein RsbR